MDKSFFCGRSMVLRCSPKILPMLCPILIEPLFYQEFHTKDGLNFLLAHGHRPVRPTRLGPSGLIFYLYPLQIWNNYFVGLCSHFSLESCYITNLHVSYSLALSIESVSKSISLLVRPMGCSHISSLLYCCSCFTSSLGIASPLFLLLFLTCRHKPNWGLIW